MKSPFRTVPCFLSRAMALLLLVALPTISWGKSMNPERFFSNQHLVAYKLAQQGQTERLVQLLATGVDVNRPGKENLTLLGLAMLTADRPAIISLIRAGANPNQVIPEVGSPAVLAITMHSNPPRTEAVEALLDAGYDPNQLLGFGKPFMFFLVDYNHWPGLKLILKKGGDVNVHWHNGKSLLTYLIEGGDYRQARELISMGADVAARGSRGETALLAIESKIRKFDPRIHEVWTEVLKMRELILSKLPDPKDRRSAFTDIVEEKIRRNPLR